MSEASHVSCRRCGAWAPVRSERCDFCGAAAPGGWRPEVDGREIRARHLGMALGGAVGGLMAMFAVEGALVHAPQIGAWLAGMWIWGGATVGAVAGLSCGALVGGWLDDEHLYPAGPRAVRQVEERIRARRAELQTSLAQMDASRKRLLASVKPGEAQAAVAALDAGRSATIKQLVRYRVELSRIDVLRWHNRLAPIEAGWPRADHATCEGWLTDLAHIRRDGEALRVDLESQGEAAAKVLGRLDQALEACEVLRQALVLRQAAALAEGAPGVADAFDPAASLPGRLDALGQGASQVEVTRLMQLLPQLEEESVRIEADLAAIEELEGVG